MPEIRHVVARLILDSRGNPTIECEVEAGEFTGSAAVPSGASTGRHEAVELRDGGDLWGGKGVSHALGNIEDIIAPGVEGMFVKDQRKLDAKLCELDGTPDKARLGANATLAVSMAVARCAANADRKPLYDYLAVGHKEPASIVPTPLLNVINGGAHAGNGLAIQEFKIIPGLQKFAEALRAAVETYHHLGAVLREKHGRGATNLGDEGGYAPPVQDTTAALDAIQEAVKRAGYGDRMRFGLDCAANNFWDEKRQMYTIDGLHLASADLIGFYEDLADTYPIASIEDPFHEEDFESFAGLTRSMRKRGVQVIGDDIFVTNMERLRQGIAKQSATALLMKFNQVGTVTEAMDAAREAQRAGWRVVVSHRSGETMDTFIADAAVALNCGQIKTGAPARGERVAKYNRLLRIEEELDGRARFVGLDALKPLDV